MRKTINSTTYREQLYYDLWPAAVPGILIYYIGGAVTRERYEQRRETRNRDMEQVKHALCRALPEPVTFVYIPCPWCDDAKQEIFPAFFKEINRDAEIDHREYRAVVLTGYSKGARLGLLVLKQQPAAVTHFFSFWGALMMGPQFYLADTATPPIYFYTDQGDPFYPNHLQYLRKLDRAGIRYRLHKPDGITHDDDDRIRELLVRELVSVHSTKTHNS